MDIADRLLTKLVLNGGTVQDLAEEVAHILQRSLTIDSASFDQVFVAQSLASAGSTDLLPERIEKWLFGMSSALAVQIPNPCKQEGLISENTERSDLLPRYHRTADSEVIA